jgi:hypothetical protein
MREDEINNRPDGWSVGLKGSTRYSKRQREFIIQKLLLREREREREVNVEMLSKIITDLEERVLEIESKGAPVKASHFLSLAFFTTITSVLIVLAIIFLLLLSS